MRQRYLITSALTILVALGLAACGSSTPSGFTTRGRPPLDPSDWTWSRPSAQMADEAEALIVRERGYAAAECVPEKSLDGTGEFNFDCVVEGRGREERRDLKVIVFGSESGEPVLGGTMGSL